MRRIPLLAIVALCATAVFSTPVAAADGPVRVRDLGPNELVQSFVPLGNRILFTADDSVHGRELYVSDGSYDGTYMVKDIAPGSASSMVWSNGGGNPNSIVAIGEQAYFVADDGVHGLGLYVTDGTSDGTIRLMRRRPCATGSNDLLVAGSRLVFAAKDASGMCNLYTTDGSVAGTLLVRADIGTFRQPRYFNGHVFFVAGAAPLDSELWKTDALPGGSLKRIARFPVQINDLTPAGQWLYFTTDIPNSSATRLWQTDGTRWGTRLVNSSDPLGANSLTAFNGKLVFGVSRYLGNGVWDKSLWRTNGHAAGTRMLIDFGTDKYSSVSRLWVGGDQVFMLAGTNLVTYGLWITDGRTPSGTQFVAKMNFNDAAALGNDLYGSGCYRDNTTVPVGCGFGALFMTSDGTADGTHDIAGAVNLLGDVAVAGGIVFINVNGELVRYTP